MSNIPICQCNTEVLSNREIGPGLYWIDLLAPDITRHALPGHFVHLVASDVSEDSSRQTWLRHTPLLRRPFSIAERDPEKGVFGLIYRIVGGGTEILAMRRRGERINVLGPLGRPLEPVRAGRSAIMVAGGVGVAPFLSLAQETVRDGRAGPEELAVLFGAATAGLLSGEEKFRRLGFDVKLATDDGSTGYHGLVTALLERELARSPGRCAYLYACGPTPMMRRCQQIARDAGIAGQVSLEGIMPCGVGVCMACVVPCVDPADRSSPRRYERVCDTGPVFDMQEVVL
ncbi:MAG: dihydroorotate dehydrogenase electron transfer subunit [Gemmatimonadetes bacterium]|nr:dihydroorotate dehydrogenase electron transfer subunit [Gemmatimonadota bacterium]